MDLCSWTFILGLLGAAAIQPLLSTLVLRQGLLVLASAWFVSTFFQQPGPFFLFFGFIASGYLAGRIVAKRPAMAIIAGYLVLLVSAFLCLKNYSFLRALRIPPVNLTWSSLVGLSYILFRQIHFVVDSAQGQIFQPTFLQYLVYQLNPFTLLAGPINRYQTFQEEWLKCEPLSDSTDALKQLQRLLLGIVKITWIAGTIITFVTALQSPLNPGLPRLVEPWWKALARSIAVFYLYPFYVYFNFAGYCDIVISGARFFGFKLPENFDRPFLARNMIEYWTRWHRTLGFWIRDYLFNPLFKAMVEHKIHFGVAAVSTYFIALFVAGIWHGSTPSFAMFGLLNGLGVAVVKLYELWLVKRIGRKNIKNYLARSRTFAVIVNFHYVCFTFLFFTGSIRLALNTLLHPFKH
ncbi:MAG: hypothetical protein JWN25_3385 [Verrucomicrobiales bacterium]|nr:hypothetical protein [Verrucomicrobiales bacterium]